MGTIVFRQPIETSPEPTQRPRAGLWGWAGAVAAALFVLALNFAYLLYHYFVDGAYVLDSAWLMDLAYRPSAGLTNPSALADPAQSYYAYHVSPIFYVLGAISWIAPADWIVYSSVLFAMQYALACLACGLASAVILKAQPGPVRLLGAVASGTALMFTGLFINAISYPHFELWFVALAGLFFVFLAYQRVVVALVFFALTLMVREDSGLLLFALIATLVVHDQVFLRAGSRRNTRLLVLLALLAIAWSVCALALGSAQPGKANLLERVYLGTPPLAHITPDFIKARIVELLAKRMDLLIIVLVALGLSIWRRRIDYLIGFAALAPWLTISILAVTEYPRLLTGYYGYPFVLASMWPILMEAMRPSASPGRGMGAPIFVAAMTAAFVASFFVMKVQWQATYPMDRFTKLPSKADVAAAHAVRAWLRDGGPARDNIVVNAPLAALEIDSVTPRNLANKNDANQQPAGMVFLDANYTRPETNDYVASKRFSRAVRLGESPIWLALPEDASAAALSLISTLATPEAPPTEFNKTFTDMLPGPEKAERTSAGFAMKPGQIGILAFGPYLELPAGDYRVAHTFAPADCARGWGDVGVETTVTADFGKHPIQAAQYRSPQLAAQGCTAKVEMDFSITDAMPKNAIEFTVIQQTPGDIRLIDVRYWSK